MYEDDGRSVWKMKSCSRMVGGLSQTVRVRVRGPPKSCVASRQARALVTSSVTAMLSSLRYSMASTREVKFCRQLLEKSVAKLGTGA